MTDTLNCKTAGLQTYPVSVFKCRVLTECTARLGLQLVMRMDEGVKMTGRWSS